MKVFVYGTLLPGELRESVLFRSRCLGPATVEGQLIDLGAYPALVSGEGSVVGLIHDVDEQMLALLDDIEGYHPDAPASSLYLRERILATYFSDGRQEMVHAYRYQGGNEPYGDTNWNTPEGEPILHGDYRRHRLETMDECQWVIAYGSNLCRGRLSERVGTPLDARRGRLPGYELCFNKQAQSGDSVYANIRWSRDPKACPAIAWLLDPEQLAILDLYEGAPDHYRRISLQFEDEQGDTVTCQGYIAQPHRLIEDGRPSDDYLEHIRRGYGQWGFCDALEP